MAKKPTYESLQQKIIDLEKRLLLVDSLERNVKVNNVFLETLFNTIPNPLFYKDIHGIYQHCNDAFSKTILGIPKEKIIGKSLYDFPSLIPKKNADIYHQKDLEILKKTGVQYYEAQVNCSDGIERYYNFYKSTFMVDNKILGLVGVMLDVSEYKKAQLELDKRNTALNTTSITDWLTGLYNRRYFEEVFARKISQLNRNKQPFAFVLLDIDFFKAYNDTYGHHAGDLALQEVSLVIKQTIRRQSDYIFRLGGEEFGILVDLTSSEDIFQLVEKIRKDIENLKIPGANAAILPYLTISAGIGNIKHISVGTKSSVIYQEVDALLYKSKECGRNQINSKDISFP